MKRRTFIKDSLLGSCMLSLPAIARSANDRSSQSFFKLEPDLNAPQFGFFAVDSLGKKNLLNNISLPEQNIAKDYTCITKKASTSYFVNGQLSSSAPAWKINTKQTTFTITSQYHPASKQSFVININQHANHATLLGMMKDDTPEMLLPALLHMPDMGTLRLTCNIPGTAVRYSSQRFIEYPFVKIELPSATAAQPKLEYHFEIVNIYPAIKGIENDDRYDCYRKNFISILQLNPFLKILSNNASSDACAFTLFKYATVAQFMPKLTPAFSALDLVRATLDRYLAGQKGYGMLGYDYDKTWDIPETPTTCDTLDAYPSLLIAACIYAMGNNDKTWFNANYSKLKHWADKMLATDRDNDGLLEFCLSGNSGSWRGDKKQRPANWWDTIGFAHKDAYSNALAYHALQQLTIANDRFGSAGEETFFKEKAAKLKAAYTDTFFNPATGILAGWKSADGKLHDYYFTFVNAVAISYGLIENKLANSIMNKLLEKIDAVGYRNFELGLPGNLIPVIRADYTDLLLEVGGGRREDNTDGFQIYENGGATACFTYFFIHALQQLGRRADADKIMLPMLKSMSDGNFQGRCANGRSKDWKTWTGECWGYEGFLVDNYMFLLAVAERGKK